MNKQKELRIGYAIMLSILFALVGFSYWLGAKSVNRDKGVCRFCGELIERMGK